MKRYLRNTVLEEIQDERQEKMLNATVLVVGAGGTGSHLLFHLASLGFGKIIIADFDTISITNLQRQILYTESQIGLNKAASAKEKLSEYNSELEYVVIEDKITSLSNIINKHKIDLIFDCTDNYHSKLMLSKESQKNDNIPVIFSSAGEFQGWVLPQKYSTSEPLLFENIFSEHKNDKNCDDLGVLSTTVGFVASIQAMEAVKLITGLESEDNDYFLDINCMTYKVNKLYY